MAQFEFHCKNLMNQRYACICSRSVSGWGLVVVLLVDLGGIMVERACTVPFFGATEVLDARKYALRRRMEARAGTMMVVCSGVARCQVFWVESLLMWTRVGDVFQDIFVSSYLRGEVRGG